jgi:alcohol dehydrogenase/propanol-preferring alcohol dehydrogenase
MSTMQAARVPCGGADFELVDLPVPDPDANEVRVEACGICHSDAFVKEGTFPGLEYPRVPGHEVAGVVDAVGSDVSAWSAGDRVGWAGTAGTASRATPAGRATSSTAKTAS